MESIFKFDITFYNSDIPLGINIVVIIANVINLIYNIPQMYKTYKRKTTKDISGLFLLFRAIASIIWTYYSFYINDIQYIIANIVTLVATLFIGYYKIRDIYVNRRINHEYLPIIDHNHTTIKTLINDLQRINEMFGNIPIVINKDNNIQFHIRVEENDNLLYADDPEINNNYLCILIE